MITVVTYRTRSEAEIILDGERLPIILLADTRLQIESPGPNSRTEATRARILSGRHVGKTFEVFRSVVNSLNRDD